MLGDLWDSSALILWGLYFFGLGLYVYGIMKGLLIKTLASLTICTIFAFITSWSIGPYVVLLLIFQEIGILIMVFNQLRKNNSST